MKYSIKIITLSLLSSIMLGTSVVNCGTMMDPQSQLLNKSEPYAEFEKLSNNLLHQTSLTPYYQPSADIYIKEFVQKLQNTDSGACDFSQALEVLRKPEDEDGFKRVQDSLPSDLQDPFLAAFNAVRCAKYHSLSGINGFPFILSALHTTQDAINREAIAAGEASEKLKQAVAAEKVAHEAAMMAHRFAIETQILNNKNLKKQLFEYKLNNQVKSMKDKKCVSAIIMSERIGFMLDLELQRALKKPKIAAAQLQSAQKKAETATAERVHLATEAKTAQAKADAAKASVDGLKLAIQNVSTYLANSSKPEAETSVFEDDNDNQTEGSVFEDDNNNQTEGSSFEDDNDNEIQWTISLEEEDLDKNTISNILDKINSLNSSSNSTLQIDQLNRIIKSSFKQALEAQAKTTQIQVTSPAAKIPEFKPEKISKEVMDSIFNATIKVEQAQMTFKAAKRAEKAAQKEHADAINRIKSTNLELEAKKTVFEAIKADIPTIQANIEKAESELKTYKLDNMSVFQKLKKAINSHTKALKTVTQKNQSLMDTKNAHELAEQRASNLLNTQKVVNRAKENLQTSQKKLAEEKEKMKHFLDAEENYDAAKNMLEVAQQTYNRSQERFDNAKAEFENAKAEVEKLNQAFEKAQETAEATQSRAQAAADTARNGVIPIIPKNLTQEQIEADQALNRPKRQRRKTLQPKLDAKKIAQATRNAKAITEEMQYKNGMLNAAERNLAAAEVALEKAEADLTEAFSSLCTQRATLVQYNERFVNANLKYNQAGGMAQAVATSEAQRDAAIKEQELAKARTEEESAEKLVNENISVQDAQAAFKKAEQDLKEAETALQNAVNEMNLANAAADYVNSKTLLKQKTVNMHQSNLDNLNTIKQAYEAAQTAHEQAVAAEEVAKNALEANEKASAEAAEQKTLAENALKAAKESAIPKQPATDEADASLPAKAQQEFGTVHGLWVAADTNFLTDKDQSGTLKIKAKLVLDRALERKWITKKIQDNMVIDYMLDFIREDNIIHFHAVDGEIISHTDIRNSINNSMKKISKALLTPDILNSLRNKNILIELNFEENATSICTSISGPSAGAAYLVAILSALTKTPIDPGIGITGAINAKGKVNVVGGIFDKINGAKNAGLHTVFLPKNNVKDVILNIKQISNINVCLYDSVEDLWEQITGKKSMSMFLAK